MDYPSPLPLFNTTLPFIAGGWGERLATSILGAFHFHLDLRPW